MSLIRNIHQLKKKSIGLLSLLSKSHFRCINSRQLWENNVQLIRQHNLEHDLNLHSYRLGMNQFGDMVIREEIFSFELNH